MLQNHVLSCHKCGTMYLTREGLASIGGYDMDFQNGDKVEDSFGGVGIVDLDCTRDSNGYALTADEIGVRFENGLGTWGYKPSELVLRL
jgi:hypothetical protein